MLSSCTLALGFRACSAIFCYRCADYVLLNKIDQLQPGRLGELTEIMKSLNPLAQVSCVLLRCQADYRPHVCHAAWLCSLGELTEIRRFLNPLA